ncbi:MAG: tetratricopeptide repeat protein [Acidobacteriota bacterium]|nr:tetratricopeptide repeat protein [Acidobacteriota bacterium]
MNLVPSKPPSSHAHAPLALLLALLLAVLLAVPVTVALHAQDVPEWQKQVLNGMRASSENNLAQAETFFLRTVHEPEAFGPQDPRLGSSLNSLGLVYHSRGKYRDAERVYLRGIKIFLLVYGPKSLDLANISMNLGTAYFDDGLYARGEPYFRNAWWIFNQSLGPDSVKTAHAIFDLGETYRNLKRYAAAALNSLALAYTGLSKYAEAEPLFKLAIGIRQSAPISGNTDLSESLKSYAAMLRRSGRASEAGRMEAPDFPRRTMQKP